MNVFNQDTVHHTVLNFTTKLNIIWQSRSKKLRKKITDEDLIIKVKHLFQNI